MLALLEGHAPGDPGGPTVAVCFSPRDLLHVPRGARVVLLGADRDPAWLNQNRPIVHEHELAVFLWDTGPEVQVLRREAPDFLDWVSHRIDVPAFPPAHAVAELRRVLARFRWVAVRGMAVAISDLPGAWQELRGLPLYGQLVETLKAGDVVMRGLASDDDAWRLLLAHAEVQWPHRVLLDDPQVVPPLVPLVDGTSADWETLARQLEEGGVPHARIEAALRGLGALPATHPARIRVLDGRAPLRPLLQTAARSEIGGSAASDAMALGLEDVAESWARRAWQRDHDLRAGAILVSLVGTRVEHLPPSPAAVEHSLNEIRPIIEHFVARVNEAEDLAREAATSFDASPPYTEQPDYFKTVLVAQLRWIEGMLAYAEGKLEAAWTKYDEARRHYEHVVERAPEHRESSLALLQCLGSLGDISLKSGMLVEARRHYERSHSIIEHHAREAPDDREIQRDLLVAYRREAALLAEEGLVQEAMSRIDVVVTALEAARAREPEEVEVQRDLAYAMRQRAELMLAMGRPRASEDDSKRALQLLASMETHSAAPRILLDMRVLVSQAHDG